METSAIADFWKTLMIWLGRATLSQCRYYLQDLDHYAYVLKEVGFEIAKKEDITDKIIESLELEREQLMKTCEEFLMEFEALDCKYLIDRWIKKTRFCRQGDFRWSLFIAQKPE